MAHDHSHSHSHDHHHHHGDDNSYYTQQMFNIAAAGALAIVTLSLWYFDRLKWILANWLQPVTVAGGIALLLLVVIRAIAVWTSVEEPHSHPAEGDGDGHAHDHDHHDHVHHAGCSHDHGHDHSHKEAIASTTASSELSLGNSAHSSPASTAPVAEEHHHAHHGHDHDHSWAPWQFVLLFLPVALFALGMPNDVFSQGQGVDMASLGDFGKASGSSEKITNLSWSQLERAADSFTERSNLEGKTVTLTGQYNGSDEAFFTLIRYKINCCAADAIPLKVVMKIDYSQLEEKKLNYEKLMPTKYRGKWVAVTGRIHFVKRKDQEQYQTALIVTPTELAGSESLGELIKEMDKVPDPYVN